MPDRLGSEWRAATASSEHVAEARANVIGETPDGYAMSLQGCLLQSDIREGRGRVRLTLKVFRAFLGVADDHPNEISFSQVYFSVTQLSSWCTGLSGFAKSAITHSENHGGFQSSIVYDRPKKISIELPDATLDLAMSLIPAVGTGSASFTESPELVLTPKTSLTVDEVFERFLDPLRNFITLATDAASVLSECTLVLADRSGGGKHETAELLYKPYGEAPKGRDLAVVEMLFALPDVREQLSEVLSRWIHLHRRLRPAMLLYFGMRYASFMYVETRFVAIVQACETLDRETRNTLSDGEYAGFCERVLSRVDEADRDHLKAILDPRDKPRLRERIRSLTGEDSPVASKTVSDPSSFARSVAATRNYLTHPGSHPPGAVTEVPRIYILGEILEYIFKDRLLQELGLDAAMRLQLFERNLKFTSARLTW
jgi:hypothetical protein